MHLVRNISITELKDYVTASRACKFSHNGCEIEAKFGIIEFDFNIFNSADICSLYICRKSGNGKVTISDEEYNIVTKSPQKIQIPLINKKISIKRPENSLGIIDIVSIELYSSDSQNGDVKVSEWKDTLNKCKYKCIRVVDNKLFASEGAVIESDKVKLISTSPPNMFTKNDNGIKFLGTCEITELEIEGEKQNVPELYQHVGDAPAPITLQTTPTQIITPMTTKEMPPEELSALNNILYDGSPSALFRLSGIKDCKFNGKSIILGMSGHLSIPIANIVPNQNYTLILEASKTIGNGKLTAHISPSGIEAAFVFTTPHHRSINLRVSSGNFPADGSLFKLIIDRPDSSTGEVAISKVVLVNQSYQLPENYRVLTKHKQILDENIIKNAIILNKLAPVKLRNEIDLCPGKDRKFVIVIPSYNNENYVHRNLESALTQDYKNFRVIYVDDCSTDKTFEKANEIITKFSGNSKTNLVKNDNRVGALENLYNAIHSCEDTEIILTLDGDDWFPHDKVLTYLNAEYKSGNVWMTYGQYENSGGGEIGICQQIPDAVIAQNRFRTYQWCSSHLRTFYSWLFKNIKKEDLMIYGTFFAMTWDFAMIFPMLEMAGKHSKFIQDILYVYNLDNPINDHKVDRRLQATLDQTIRQKQKYTPISITNNKNMNKTKIGLLLISTGKYHPFIEPLISSADRYFFNSDEFDVSYFLFSDKDHELSTSRNVKQITINHVPFPYATMNRFKYFTQNGDKFEGMDYLYYVDIDCLFMNTASTEVLGDLVGVRHCGFYNGGGSFEDNPKSVLFRPVENYKHYYGGGFQGGKKENYLQLAKWCYEKIEEDLSNEIVPKWHDETALNTYLSENPPTTSLIPTYHYPQNVDHFIKNNVNMRYLKDMLPVILLLEKNHQEIRS